MIDPKKYMVVMAVAVVPRKDLGSRCGDCGRGGEPFLPLVVSLEDGTRVVLEPQFFVGSRKPKDGRWHRLSPGGLEDEVQNALARLLNDADQILTMHKGLKQKTAVVVQPAQMPMEGRA